MTRTRGVLLVICASGSALVAVVLTAKGEEIVRATSQGAGSLPVLGACEAEQRTPLQKRTAPVGEQMEQEEASCIVTTLDSTSGEAVAGVEIYASGRRLGTTDESGRVQVPAPTDIIWLFVRSQGHMLQEERLLPFQETAQLWLAPSSRRIEGTVVGNGRPVAGATVAVETAWSGAELDLERLTDEEGIFRTVGLPPGTPVMLVVEAPGFGRETQLVTREEHVVVEMDEGLSVRGTVCQPDGSPVSGAHVVAVEARHEHQGLLALWARRVRARARTAPDGSFRLVGLESGEIFLVAGSAEGGGGSAGPLRAGTKDETRIVLAPPTGLLVRAHDIHDYDVEVIRTEPRRTTVCVSGPLVAPLDPGEYRVRVLGPDHPPWTSTVKVHAGVVSEVVADPSRGVELRGTVVDVEGQPVQGAEVCFRDASGVERRSWTNARGDFRLSGLSREVGSLSVTDWRGRYAASETAVRPSGAEVGVMLRPAARVTGRVSPVPAARSVKFRLETDNEAYRGSLRLSEEGEFDLAVPFDGEPLDLILFAAEGLYATTMIPFAPGEQRRLGTCIFAASELRGRVLRTDGRPACDTMVGAWHDLYDIARATVTDAHGEFCFPLWPEGESSVTVCIDGPGGPTFDVTAGEFVEIRLP